MKAITHCRQWYVVSSSQLRGLRPSALCWAEQRLPVLSYCLGIIWLHIMNKMIPIAVFEQFIRNITIRFHFILRWILLRRLPSVEKANMMLLLYGNPIRGRTWGGSVFFWFWVPAVMSQEGQFGLQDTGSHVDADSAGPHQRITMHMHATGFMSALWHGIMSPITITERQKNTGVIKITIFHCH